MAGVVTQGPPLYFFTQYKTLRIHLASELRGIQVYPTGAEQSKPALIFLDKDPSKREVQNDTEECITAVKASCSCRLIVCAAADLGGTQDPGQVVMVENGPECGSQLTQRLFKGKLPVDGLFHEHVVLVFHDDGSEKSEKAKQEGTVLMGYQVSLTGRLD